MSVKKVLSIFAAIIIIFFIVVIVVLKSYDFNSLKPKISSFVRDFTGRELVLGGDINLKIGFTPSLVVENVSFQNAEWGSRPELAKVKRFEVRVALIPLIKKNIVVKRFNLIEPDILIETDSKGRSNLEFDTKGAEGEVRSEEEGAGGKGVEFPSITINDMGIMRGKLAYRDGKSGSSYNVHLNKLLAYASGVDTPIELTIEGAYDNEPFRLQGGFGSLASFIDPEKPWPLDIGAKLRSAEITAGGFIQDPLKQTGIDLSFSIKGSELKELEHLTGSHIPIQGHYDVTGRVSDFSRKSYKIANLRVSLSDMDFSGNVEVNLSGKRPKIDASLSSKKIDLRPLLPEEKWKETRGIELEEKKERVFPDDPINIEGLNSMDIGLKLLIERLFLPQLALNNINLELLVDDGRLSIKPLKGVIGGGTIEGNISLKPQSDGMEFVSSVNAENLEIGDMLKELAITQMLEGDLDIKINLRGSGGSVAGLMAGLNGDISGVMGNGRIANKYINLIGADLSSSIFRMLNPANKGGDFTEINCFVVRFDIVNGIAESTAFVFDTDQMSVVGDGKINLRDERLDISLRPSPKKGLGGGERVSLSLGELAKPFKLGGTLAKPSLAVDPTQAAMTIGKAVGGIALFGPAGIAAALVSGGSGDGNPCVAALEAAKTGVKMAPKEGERAEKEMGIEDAEKGIKGVKEGIKGFTDDVEGIGRDLKKLFGK